MANLTSSADDTYSSAFDLCGAYIFVLRGGDMKRTRKAKTMQQRATSSKVIPNSPASRHTWHSVIVDAEEQMAQLRRTIEWTNHYLRSRLDS